MRLLLHDCRAKYIGAAVSALPDLEQETKLDILTGLNVLALGNANTAKAIVE